MAHADDRNSLGRKQRKRVFQQGPDELSLKSFIIGLAQLDPAETAVREFCDLLDAGLRVFDSASETINPASLKKRLLQAENQAAAANFADFADFARLFKRMAFGAVFVTGWRWTDPQ